MWPEKSLNAVLRWQVFKNPDKIFAALLQCLFTFPSAAMIISTWINDEMLYWTGYEKTHNHSFLTWSQRWRCIVSSVFGIVRPLQSHDCAAAERVPLTISRASVWFRDVFPPPPLVVYFTPSESIHDVSRSVIIISGWGHLLLTTCFVVLLLSFVLVWGSADFLCVKGQIVNIFTIHCPSQLFNSYCVKLAINSTWRNEQGCVLIKLYLKKQTIGQIWPSGCHMLTPV